MLISIITLNYKKENLTIACMESLYIQFKEEFEKDLVELIIVDNASLGESVNIIRDNISKKKYQNIKLIESSENGGFGKGCNLGAQKAEGEYLLFLNNDTVVKDSGILKMAKYLGNNPNVSILGGQLRNVDGSLQASAGAFYTLFKAIMLLLGMQKLGLLDKSPKEISKVDWVKGGLLMIRKNIFEKLKGFDEKIFMYTEDMELCYRAKLKGYQTFFYPNTYVLHAEHGSTNRTFAIVNIYKNLLYFYKKHRSFLEYLILKTLLMLKAYLLITIGILKNNKYLKETYREALLAIK
ncbi:MAG: glycosyltransferase family 2 protein [Patescibacteria group bacterium]|mgnify:CR=1 FL=1